MSHALRRYGRHGRVCAASTGALPAAASAAPSRSTAVTLRAASEGLVGEAVTSNGRYLLIATGSDATVVSTARLERGGCGLP